MKTVKDVFKTDWDPRLIYTTGKNFFRLDTGYPSLNRFYAKLIVSEHKLRYKRFLYCLEHDTFPSYKPVIRCILCRQKSYEITKHHVIPKPYRLVGHYVPQIPVCRPCHDAIHIYFRNRELMEYYNTPSTIRKELEKRQQITKQFDKWIDEFGYTPFKNTIAELLKAKLIQSDTSG